MEKRHIVCCGDSNTHGYRASDDGRYDEQERWTCLLQKQLGDGYLIIEEGLSRPDSPSWMGSEKQVVRPDSPSSIIR